MFICESCGHSQLRDRLQRAISRGNVALCAKCEKKTKSLWDNHNLPTRGEVLAKGREKSLNEKMTDFLNDVIQ